MNIVIASFTTCVHVLQPETQLPFAPLTGVLYQSPSNESHYIISARDFENVVDYFITAGTTYQIQVRHNY